MERYVIISFNGSVWAPARAVAAYGPPLAAVRDLLQGRWTRCEGHVERDGASAFWNSSNGRRVLVMTERAAMTLQIAAGVQ